MLLQQTVGVRRDKQVSYSTSKGKMNYAYTTLPEFWESVQDFFKQNQLVVNWSSRVHSVDADVLVLICKVVDTEDESYVESQVPLRMAHADFRFDGARYTYWCRMAAIRTCGLIDDDDGEIFGRGEGAELSTVPARGTANKKKPSDDEIVY